MQFLIDEDVDVRVIKVLKRLGHEARRVPSGTTNGSVLRLAHRERRILITRDSDFTNTTMYPPSRYSGIIHLAIHPPWLENIAPPLTQLLKSASESDIVGKVIVLNQSSA